MITTAEKLLHELLIRPSISPDDSGCMDILQNYLTPANIHCRRIDIEDTANLFASHGNSEPHICFVGHVDVVPAGNDADWHSPPFTPTVRDGKLYARGVADMKSGVVAMAVAFRELIEKNPHHGGTISMLITSDEEALATHGIQAVLPILAKEGTNFTYAIVGEPTAEKVLGDFARNGRRGSLHLALTITGKQGHIACPENVRNPIHGLGAIIAKISAIKWDNGNAIFPPSSCQFSNISASTNIENVVPQQAYAKMNWRFNTEQSEENIRLRVKEIVEQICVNNDLHADYQWRLSGLPFCTNNQTLISALSKAVEKHCQVKPVFNTAGGTSDARFMAQYGAETIEFGTLNKSIHQVNEHFLLTDLAPMIAVYHDTVINLL